LDNEGAHSIMFALWIGEYDRDVGYASVRYPGLASIQEVIGSFVLKGCSQRGGVAARGWLCEPKAHYFLSSCRLGKIALFLIFVPPFLHGQLAKRDVACEYCSDYSYC